MTTPTPLPNPDDPLSAPFWAGLRERRLLVQRCDGCGARRLPPAPICPECLFSGSEWVPIPDCGVLWSYVFYRRALAPAFAGEVPYAVGVVELEGDLQLLSRIDGPVDAIVVGQAMRATYHDVTDSVTLLRWTPDSDAADVRG